MKTIERVAREAEAAGMTYGMYVALTEHASDRDRAAAIPGWTPGWKPEAKPKKKTTRSTCARCGGEMVRTNNRQLYCAACQEEKNRENSREYQRKRAEERRRLRERDLICPICGEHFRTTVKRRVYCSIKCGEAAWQAMRREYRRRQREEEREKC